MKIPILLITNDRPYILEKVLTRILSYTDWNKFDLWILENRATAPTKKIIQAFKAKYSHINVYSSFVNQISYIQNCIIRQLRSDIYIKLDDDIFVSEGWTNGFVGVYERNYKKMSFGSVIIPVNGFGWLPFMEIMGIIEEFKSKFPDEKLIQDCMNVSIWNNEKVVEYIWNKSLNIDEVSRTFKEKQNNNFQDLICTHRYSIGAIVFSHDVWDKMGGWKIKNTFYNKLKIKTQYEKIFKKLAKMLNKPKLERTSLIMDILLNLHKSELGLEEQAIFDFSLKNDLIIPITTESIVFHFSFGTTDDYITKNLLLKLK